MFSDYNVARDYFSYLVCASIGLSLGALNSKASGTANVWTGAAGNLLWSDAQNWSNIHPAGSADSAQFDSGPGATNAPGKVNSIVEVDTTVQQLWYSPVLPTFHTTLVQPGATLSVRDPSLVGDLFALRLNTGPSTAWSSVTITGGGRLVVGDTNNPATLAGGGIIRIHAPSVSAGPYWATLDMSGLDYFACAPSEIRVGANGSSAGTQGTLILARTNLLIVGSSVPVGSYVGFTIGHTSASTDYPSAGDVQLGQENVLRADTLRVGSMRAANTSLGGPGGGYGEASKAGAGGTMEFRSGLVNPRVTLRGINGTGSMQQLLIGDNSQVGTVNTTNTASGVLDLSGGKVDGLVNEVVLGRNNANTTTTRTGSGHGVLSWTDGAIRAEVVRVGCQTANNRGDAIGVVNVRSNAVFNVTGAFSLGGDLGGASGSGRGTLNIVHGGLVSALANIGESNGVGGNGASAINLTNGTLHANGMVGVDSLNVIGSKVFNATTATVSRLAGNGTIYGPVTVLERLTPGQFIGELTILKDLVLSPGATSVFEINLDTLNSDKVAGLERLTFGGALVISNVGGMAAVTSGMAFKLFDAKFYSGNFSSIILPGLPEGLHWSTNELASEGVLIILSELIVPPQLVVQPKGQELDVSWSVDRPGWWLEGQTNATGVGLDTNWYPIANSAGTNRISLPIDTNLGSAFSRLAYVPSMKSLRKAAADRRRRIIFNNDGNEPVYQMSEPTVEQLLGARTVGVVNSQVDSIFYCPWSSGFSLFTYFTKVGQPFTSREGRYGTNQMPALIESGIDPLKVMVDFGKQHGIEIFCSFRMNDTHDGSTADYGPPLLRTNKLKQAHPEYLIGTAASKPKHGEWTAVNYARQEIRELAFRFAEEVCLNYDVDGLEFDFFRHPVFFKSNAAGAVATDAERGGMTELFQRIRSMADKVGRSRGRPILIAMRLPDSVDYCRAIGLDLENWLSNDLVDLLVVSGYFQLNDWNYSVALARQYGVKVYPALDPCIISDATSRAARTTDLSYRGRAANVWGFGADGVYTFNLFNSNSQLWHELGNPQGLATMDKDYFGSVRGVVVAAGGNLPFNAYQTVETLNPSNGKTVAPGGSATARINVGEDLSKAGPVTLKVRLRFKTGVDPRHLEVHCNNVPVSFLGFNATWMEYSVPVAAVSRPFNQVKVSLTAAAPQAVWTDLMLQVRH